MPIQKDFYLPIYRILISHIDEKSKLEKTANWLLANHKKIKMSVLKETFRNAGRSDLISAFIEDVEISIGDLVLSRWTSRRGIVTEIKSDGETIVVKWNTGGSQQLSKEHVIILNKDKDNHFNKEDFSNAKTMLPGYTKHNKKDMFIDTSRDVHKPRGNHIDDI